MELSPEERKRIYEEEKTKLEAEEGTKTGKDKGTRGLKPNIAGLLCYVGFWVTGIIFLFIEKKDRLVRFHAMQSLVTFGILNIIWGVANNIRWTSVWTGWGGFFYPQYIAATVVFGVFFAIWWILWGILMYKTYHGRPYRVRWFCDLAERCLAKLDTEK